MASISQLVCFLLFWSLTVVVLAGVAKENPLKESIGEAQDKLLNAQSTIIRIHAGEIIAESLEDLKVRLSLLQIEIEKLIQSTNGRSAESEACMAAMNNLTSSYHTIDSQLRGLQMEFEKHNIFENRTLLFRDILADIRSKRFRLADEKFILLNDLSVTPKIVHEVYAFSEDNMELIVGFSAVISDSARCFAVLKSLFEEMGIDDPSEKVALKLISLAKELDEEDLICNSTDTTFRDDLIRRIEMATADVFIRSMEKGDDFQKSKIVRKLLDGLYDFSPKIFDIVMKRLIDATYGKVDARVVLLNIFNRCTTAQAISGISNLFWKIKESGRIYESDLILEFASKLSELVTRKDFYSLSGTIIQSFEELVNSIPRCAKNLFFGKSVCFWNKAKNAYLHAANATFNYDPERRRVLTISSNELPHGARWIAVRQGSDILFRSKQYPKEFLYYANFEFNAEERFVFSWITGENRDNQSAFKIELLNNESCYLKSTRYNEYMHASEIKFEKDMSYSYVFASRSGKAGGVESAFAWQIKAC